jgi:hypothetical protein
VKKSRQGNSASTAGGVPETAVSYLVPVIKHELLRQLHTESEELPAELAAAVAQSVTGIAVELYEARLQAGLSTVRLSKRVNHCPSSNALIVVISSHRCSDL